MRNHWDVGRQQLNRKTGMAWCGPAARGALQVASFRGLGSAERLRGALAEAGYAAELAAVVLAGRRWHRVQLLDFASRADAQAVGVQLQTLNSALAPRAVFDKTKTR